MNKNYWFWMVAIIGLILDQVTKFWAVATLPNIGGYWELIPKIFHFTYIENTGAAFSFFEDGAVWLRWLSLFVSLALIIYGWRENLTTFEQVGYGFILSGALGNGMDRFLFGYVVDFLDFRVINFPVFNIADVCINLGIIFLFYAIYQESFRKGE